jgi:hypothetical protein
MVSDDDAGYLLELMLTKLRREEFECSWQQCCGTLCHAAVGLLSCSSWQSAAPQRLVKSIACAVSPAASYLQRCSYLLTIAYCPAVSLLRRYATQAAKEEQDRRRAQYQEQLKRQQEAEAARQQQQQQGATPSQQQQQQQTPPQQQQQTPSTPLASGNSTPDMGGSGSQLQVIGMSATLPNVDQVAAWLDAVLYQTDFRPVQLRQYIKLGRLMKDQEGEVLNQMFRTVLLCKQHFPL